MKSPQKEYDPSQSVPRKESEPHSWVPQWQEWLAVSTALADETSPQGETPEVEVRQVLEKYRQAYEQKDPALLETVYATFTPTQREANVKYFQNTQE